MSNQNPKKSEEHPLLKALIAETARRGHNLTDLATALGVTYRRLAQWRSSSAVSTPKTTMAALPGSMVQSFLGLRRNWLMAVAICDAPQGYDTSSSPYKSDCNVVEWHLTPSRVQRVLSSGQVMEELAPNGLLIRPAGVPLPIVSTGPAKFVHFCIPDDLVRTVAVDWLGETANRGDLLLGERVMKTDSTIAPMLDAYLRRALDDDEPPSRLEMDSRAHLIVLQLLKRHSILAEKTQKVLHGGLAPYHLKRVCELMTKDLAEEIPLSVLASKVGVSYHHFCHAFKASMGMAPHQWLVERRVDAACELLRTTRLSVTEIAATVGYDDPNQLLRVFRGRRGTTPASYRREFQERGGIALNA